jgi:hypothetical protein
MARGQPYSTYLFSMRCGAQVRYFTVFHTVAGANHTVIRRRPRGEIGCLGRRPCLTGSGGQISFCSDRRSALAPRHERAAVARKLRLAPGGRLTGWRVSVIKHALVCLCAEYAGFRWKVEEADGFSAFFAVKSLPCTGIRSGSCRKRPVKFAFPARLREAADECVCRELAGKIWLV